MPEWLRMQVTDSYRNEIFKTLPRSAKLINVPMDYAWMAANASDRFLPQRNIQTPAEID